MDIERLLDEKNVKPTANRILVARALSKVSHPVSLNVLEAAMEFSMDKVSVFRVLELFAEKDVVHVIEDGSRSVKYELCGNPNHHSIDDQHVHFYCEQCKETFCFETVKVPVVEMPESFAPRAINYMVKGRCPKCKG